ncbi:Hypothetical predicted protein [Cloeon dipterum]|uniref:Protein CUSTOS n=1 Tax=Cloeon dipterum TaxID=197152 RepID=A0A8S1CPM0_9INSE|nr:Hypothetical predicted protein [Cloeon dipterum]
MSDSSSDEEENLNLRDALAPGFTIESVKNHLSGVEENLPSNRVQKSVSVRTKAQYQAPVVSEDNQKYLAKQLSAFLEKQIKEGDVIKRVARKEESNDVGVRLLSSSFVFLSPDQSEDTELVVSPRGEKRKQFKVKKRKLAGEPEEADEATKAKEAAVSVEWVLQKEGDSGPLCRKPGEVIPGRHHESFEFELKLQSLSQ